MRLFRFEKWFTDVLTPSGDYLIVFHSLLELFGFRLCFVEINISRNQKNHGFHLNRRLFVRKRQDHCITSRHCDFLFEQTEGRIRLKLPELMLDLNIKPLYPSDFRQKGMTILNRGGDRLNWKPLYLKSEMKGEIVIKAHDLLPPGQPAPVPETLEGLGYTDYIVSGMSPWNMPVVYLFWGRLHTRELDLTYSFAAGKQISESVGAGMMICVGGECYWLEHVSLVAGQWEEVRHQGISCPTLCSVKAASGEVSLEMEVRHVKAAIVSEFLDHPKELGRLAGSALRHLSKDARGIKYYSSASLRFVHHGEILALNEVSMIHEYVRFI